MLTVGAEGRTDVGLTSRRTWAEVPESAPDGSCLDLYPPPLSIDYGSATRHAGRSTAQT